MFKLFSFVTLILSMQVNAASLSVRLRDTIPSMLTKSEYKAKSKSQLTGAIMLASVGGATMIVGIGGAFVIAADAVIHVGAFDYDYKPKSGDGYIAAIIVGAVVALTSIPLFISANKNRKLAKGAASVALNIEGANRIQSGAISKYYFPAVRLTLRF